MQTQLTILLKRLVDVEPEELRALLWSFSYFFALLCSYYIVRPMRDEMGVAGVLRTCNGYLPVPLWSCSRRCRCSAG